jgi:Domain of unknown function (DUF4351)
MPTRTDQDSPWKDIIRQYFSEAITFFFPATAALIDWSRPIEFLDKEFQQIAPDAEIGKRYADYLVKVWRKQGNPVILLLHLEIQARPEAIFPERLFIYNFRIFDLYHHPAISLAILCDNNANWRPNTYEFNYPDTQLHFRFKAVKLLDYQAQWESLEQSCNPFATVVMAHLKAQETKRDAQSRKEWKLWLVRRLYEGGYSRQDVVNLFKFIDWIIILPAALKQSFWSELRTYEEERRMPYITSVEEIGFERGLKEGEARGEARGQQEGKRSLVLRQLTRRIGTLPDDLRSPIAALSPEQVESLGEALLDFTSLTDLETWLTAQS